MTLYCKILVILIVVTTVSMRPYSKDDCDAERNEEWEECPGMGVPSCRQPIQTWGDGTCTPKKRCGCKKNYYIYKMNCVPASVCAEVYKDFDERLKRESGWDFG
uniref:TIL domain-containing protein n=1 Tax=Panagrellus redivivus TaxID=6233 RepID=A0A7E4UYC5_PANRE